MVSVVLVILLLMDVLMLVLLRVASYCVEPYWATWWQTHGGKSWPSLLVRLPLLDYYYYYS